jgi:hypothetical protein
MRSYSFARPRRTISVGVRLPPLPLVVEHLAKVAGIHPFAADRASIQILGFVFGRIVLPARELNYRTVLFSHLVPPMREPECLTESGVGSVVIHIVSQQISVGVAIQYRAGCAIDKFGTVKQNRADQCRAFCVRRKKRNLAADATSVRREA